MSVPPPPAAGPRRRFSLRARLVAFVTLPVVLVAGGLVVIWTVVRVGDARDEAARELRSIAVAMTQDCQRQLLMDEQSVAVDLAARLRSFPQLRRLDLLDAAGNVAFSYRGEGEDRAPLPEGGGPTSWTGDRLALTLPVAGASGRPLGSVRLEAVAEEMHAAAADAWTSAGISLGAVVLVGALLLLRLRRSVMDPLARLTRQAEALGRGDLETEIRGERADELGSLASTLEAMRLNLHGSYARILAQNAELLELTRVKELALGQAIFRSFFDHAPDAILVADDEGSFVDANPAACALLGRKREEIVGGKVGDFNAEADRPRARAAFLRMMDEGLCDGLARLCRPDGSTRDVEVSARARVLPGRHLAVLRDVTARREEEETLARVAAGVSGRTGDELFGALAQSLGVVVGADLVFVARFESPRRDRLETVAVARGGREAPGFAFPLLGSACADSALRGATLRFSGPDLAAQFPDDQVLRDAGAESFRVHPLAVADGRVLGVLALVHHAELPRLDRARILLDIFVARASAEFARLEADAKAAEAQTRLRESQKMEAVGRLAGGVAHDYNNLLTTILGFGRRLKAKLGSAHPEMRSVDHIVRAGERAADVTRQLLAFGRRQLLQTAVLDLREVVASAAPMLERLAGESISLRVVRPPDLGAVEADRGQMEQILVHLVAHARDEMPGGGALTIETADVELDPRDGSVPPDVRPGRYVLLSVSDTGPGMDAATLARIFEPFFSTSARGHGTGLGLATVYGAVRQSEGHVDARSTPGVGTTIRAYLPRVEAPARAPKDAEGEDLPRGTETVLLVEDEEGVRELARSVLVDLGYRVVSAESGSAALRAAEATDGPIDLVVTDVVMPGMSGRELVERVAVGRPRVRALFMSGHTDDDVLRHGILRQEKAFLAKPFAPSALAGKVRAALDHADVAAALAR